MNQDSPLKVKAIKRTKKTKPIQKEEKKQGQKSTRKGRPHKKDTQKQEEQFSIDSEYNDVDLCKNQFLTYNHDIGFSKGMVFPEEPRKKLRAQQQAGKVKNKVQWDYCHMWNPDEEKKKVSEVFENVQATQEIEEGLIEHLKSNFIDIADIYPREITQEIYKILLKVALQAYMQKKSTEELAQQIYNSEEYIFLTGKFSNICKPTKPVLSALKVLLEKNYQIISDMIGKYK